MPKLAHSLNKPVAIANPAYFGDDAPRRLILVDIEPSGLWFSGEALHAPLTEHALTALPEDAVATVFFPFEQISFLFDPRQLARVSRGASVADRLAAHPAYAAQPRAPAATVPDDGKGRRPSSARPAPRPPKPTR